MSNPTFTLQMTLVEQCFTTITVWKHFRRRCNRTGRMKKVAQRMEFRGDGIKQWGMGREHLSPEHDHLHFNNGGGKPPTHINWACWLHDNLMGLHTCIFYTGDKFAIHDRHEDYEVVARLWELGNGMTDREVIALNGGML